MTSEEKEAILDAINQIREELGYVTSLTEIPQGRPQNPWTCPVKKALGGRVSSVGSSTYRIGRVRVTLPLVLRRFIKRFDRGCYPELIRRSGWW